MGNRIAEIVRKTKETDIRLRLDLDGQGQAEVKTGVGFLDHMLELLSKHSGIDLGDRAGIRRYGHAVLPMDETLVTCAVDLGGRAFWVWNAPMPSAKIGTFDSELVADFWQAFTTNARLNLHVLLHYGRNTHHVSEAIFKGLGKLGDVDSLKTIHGYFDDKEADVAKAALMSAAEIRNVSSIDLMINLMKKYEKIDEQAKKSGGGYGVPYGGGQDPKQKLAKDVLPTIIKALQTITHEKWATTKEWEIWWNRYKATFKIDK